MKILARSRAHRASLFLSRKLRTAAIGVKEAAGEEKPIVEVAMCKVAGPTMFHGLGL